MPKRAGWHIDDARALGRRLREARERAGLSQRELAFAGCTAPYISRIEAGERIPSLQLVREFAKRLDISEEYLARGEVAQPIDPLDEAEIALRLGDLDDAEAQYAVLVEVPAARARALAGLGQVRFLRGDHVQAELLLEDAVDSEPAIAADPAVVDMLARAHALMGQYPKAIAMLERRLAEAEERQDAVERLRFSVLLANTLIDSGNLPRAEELLGRTLAVAADWSDPLMRARVWWTQSRLHVARGEADAAVSYARLALDVLVLTEHAAYAARAHQLLAHIELDRGNAEEALALLEHALPLVRESGNRYDETMFSLEKARALAQLGRYEEAGSLAHEASGLLAEVSPIDAGRAYALLAEIHEMLGDTARAIEVYELAAEVLPASDRYLVQVYAQLGQLLRAEGRKDEALEVYARALSVQAARDRTAVQPG